MRHADAGDRDEFARTGRPDTERPLSDKGRDQARAVARGLRSLFPECDVIATSALTRATQTAEIIAQEYGHGGLETTSALEPESAPREFAEWIVDYARRSVVIAVGHEPHLGILAAWLAGESSPLSFRKAGACLLAFDGPVARGAGQLKWLRGPAELRPSGT